MENNMTQIYKFESLKEAPLVVDAIYEGGKSKNISDDPLPILLPNVGNQGGFRKTNRKDGTKLPAFVVIYTTMEELEWPDFLDTEIGIFRYYGDNRKSGKDLHETQKGGNSLLKETFRWLNEGKDSLKKIPPFLIFRRTGKGKDVQFLGLAAPGNINIPPDRDLISFWRTMDDQRFQNYEAYFTILDSKDEKISKEWLNSLIYTHDINLEYAPECWKEFIQKGRVGIKALKAPKISKIPTRENQMPSDLEGITTLRIIREYYENDPFGFEKCATAIVQMMDSNFYEFELTRPWRDGGRDAIGKYRIGAVGETLTIDCALEAKCYGEKNSVGVKQMSRLISRIKYRQFGIMVTTSCVDKQAYGEIIEDGHPILVVNAKDIAEILRKNGYNSMNILEWLDSLN